MKKRVLASTLGLLAISQAATALLEDIDINGFFTVGAASSNVEFVPNGLEPVYISEIGKRPSFDRDTRVGLQVAKYFHEKVVLTAELLGQGIDYFDVEATQAYIGYQANDKWAYKLGRMRTAPLLLSEVQYVGYTIPWIRVPEAVYLLKPHETRHFNGLDIRYQNTLCEWKYMIGAFYGAGTSHIAFPIIQPNNSTIFTFDIQDDVDLYMRDVGSFFIKIFNDYLTLHAGYETFRMEAYPNAGTYATTLNLFLNNLVAQDLIGGDYQDFFSIYRKRMSIASVGYQFEWNNVVSIAEWAKRHSGSPVVGCASGWYVMGGYRCGDVLPHITFSRQRVKDNWVRRFSGEVNQQAYDLFGQTLDTLAQLFIVPNRFFDGGVGDQTALTLGLRWDIFEGIAIKGEWQHVHPDNLSRGLFDLHTGRSANIYSVSLDAII